LVCCVSTMTPRQPRAPLFPYTTLFRSGADGRIALTGNSQGGGLALGTAGLVPDVDALAANVPFLTHMRRAVQITDADPYQEIVRYLAAHRDLEEQTFTTLAYLDPLHLGRRAPPPAERSVALRHGRCPP